MTANNSYPKCQGGHEIFLENFDKRFRKIIYNEFFDSIIRFFWLKKLARFNPSKINRNRRNWARLTPNWTNFDPNWTHFDPDPPKKAQKMPFLRKRSFFWDAILRPVFCVPGPPRAKFFFSTHFRPKIYVLAR